MVKKPSVQRVVQRSARVRRLAAELVSRAAFSAIAGVTYGGARDLFSVLGYKRELGPEDYWARYERNEVAGRVVDAFPNATWRGGGELVEDENPDVSTPFEAAWDLLSQRLSVWSVFRRADILASLGRFGVILIGAPGDLEQELPKLRPEQVAYLAPFSERDVTIQTTEEALDNPRFGQPTLYALKRIGSKTSSGRVVASTRQVHWTRIIHVVPELLDDAVYGQPRLRRPWNRLDDLEKVAGSGSEAFWKRVHQGLQLDIDKDLDVRSEDLADLKTQVDEYEHGLRRVFRTRGVKLETMGSDVASFKDQIDGLLTLISVGTEIPKRIFMGSERGELASTQDRDNWNSRVVDRRNEFAGPQIVRPFVDRLIERGALPQPKQYEVRWPEIQNLNELEQADLAVKIAEMNQKNGEPVITTNEIRDRCFRMEPLDELDEPLDNELDEPGLPEPDEQGDKSGQSEKNGKDETGA